MSRYYAYAFFACAALSATLLFTACGDDDDDDSNTEPATPTQEPERSELIPGTWSLEDEYEDSADVNVNLMEDCGEDNTYTFTDDDRVQFDDGDDICNPMLPPQLDGDWELTDQDSVLAIDWDALPFVNTYTVDTLTATRAVLRSKEEGREGWIQTTIFVKAE